MPWTDDLNRRRGLGFGALELKCLGSDGVVNHRSIDQRPEASLSVEARAPGGRLIWASADGATRRRLLAKIERYR